MNWLGNAPVLTQLTHGMALNKQDIFHPESFCAPDSKVTKIIIVKKLQTSTWYS